MPVYRVHFCTGSHGGEAHRDKFTHHKINQEVENMKLLDGFELVELTEDRIVQELSLIHI